MFWVVALLCSISCNSAWLIAQALVLLELVEPGADLARQPEQHLFTSGGANTLAVVQARSADERGMLVGVSSVGLNSRSV